MDEDDVIVYKQVLRLPDRSCHYLVELNPVGDGGGGKPKINPNSAILCYF